MRATEFTNRQQSILEGKNQVQIGDLILDYHIDGANVDVRAIVDDKQVGYVIFNRDGRTLFPDDLAVDAEYRGRGIAKKMYDFVKSLPQRFDIIRGNQTSMGKRFWDKNRGEHVDVWEEDVAEDLLNEFASTPRRGDGDDDSKYIPWQVFVKGIAYLLKDNFTLQMTQQPRQVKARFVPIDPMEYGPSQIYAYDDPRYAYDKQKRGVGIQGMMHVGKYSKGHDGKLLTGYYSQELDGNKWIQFTLANIPKVAAIITGNKEGALQQDVAEAWSEKYKRSINCDNPRGFSQRAHCKGRNKK